MDVDGQRLQVRVLGPLSVLLDGVPVPLPGPKPRRLLACLALRAPEPVDPAALLDVAWPDGKPRTAHSTLHTHLSHLRTALGGGTSTSALVRTDAGYLLDVPPEHLDAHRFSRLVGTGQRCLQAGQPAAAASALTQALAEWRGDPLTDVEEQGFAEGAIARLTALRTTARAALVEALLGVGRSADAADVAAALVADEPFDEHARALQVRALGAAGRRADALAAFAAARTLLREELGLDPGAELTRAHIAVLRDESPEVPVAAGTRPQRPPEPRTPLVGRAIELARLRQMLTTRRLVTITGVGGVGKTRLACAAAAEQAGRVTVAYADLGRLRPQDDPRDEMARAVGIVAGADEWDRAVIDRLHAQPTLLLLDSCEHLLDAVAPAIDRLLQGAEDLTVLATSREPLALAGETVLRLGPLPVPDAGGEVPGTALALLDGRIAAARGGRPRTVGEEEAALRICHSLDGIPLALELVAAQADTASLEDLANQIPGPDPPCRLRGAIGRHHTMAAAIAWSEDLLPPWQRRLLHRLSIFAGDFGAEDAAVVCADQTIPPPAVAAGLRDLRSASLVESDGASLRLLGPVRAFAADRLAADPDAPATARRHLTWVERMVAPTETGLRGPSHRDIRGVLERRQPEVLAALHRAVDHGWLQDAARVVGRVWWLWFRSGHLYEGARWAERLLVFADEMDLATAADLRTAAMHFRWQHAQWNGALTEGLTALRTYRRLGDDRGVAQVLPLLGWMRVDTDPRHGERLLRRAAALQQQLGDEWGVWASRNMLADALLRQGRGSQATALYAESARWFAARGDDYGLSWAQCGLASAALSDDPRRALRLAAHAGRLCARIGHHDGVAMCVAAAALATAAVPDLARAGDLLAHADAVVASRPGFHYAFLRPALAALRTTLGQAELHSRLHDPVTNPGQEAERALQAAVRTAERLAS